jgi:hypothetical protein
MISEAEILHIISEIHQYDVILVELRDGTVFGIVKGIQSAPEYFQARAAARTTEDRKALLEALRESRPETHVDQITLETLLNGLRGMKTRHVWLERATKPRHEMVFLTLRELASFLQKHQV